MKILLVEDNWDILNAIKRILNREKFSVDFSTDGLLGFNLARLNNYDLLILDNRLPNKNGADICYDLRMLDKKMPILILSVLNDVEQKVELLEAGADDYMVKPFSAQELLARIRALLRRPNIIKGDLHKIDDLILDTKKKNVFRGEKQIDLTRKEYLLLEYLLKNQGMILSRKMIMEKVWDMDLDPFSNTVESHILSLRKKITLEGKKKLIYTVSGMGYKIELK